MTLPKLPRGLLVQLRALRLEDTHAMSGLADEMSNFMHKAGRHVGSE